MKPSRLHDENIWLLTRNERSDRSFMSDGHRQTIAVGFWVSNGRRWRPPVLVCSSLRVAYLRSTSKSRLFAATAIRMQMPKSALNGQWMRRRKPLDCNPHYVRLNTRWIISPYAVSDTFREGGNFVFVRVRRF